MVNVSAGTTGSSNTSNVSSRRRMHADPDEEDGVHSDDDDSNSMIHVRSEHLQEVTLDNDVVMVSMETERGIPVEEDLTPSGGLSAPDASPRKKRQLRFGIVVLVGWVLLIVLGVSIPANNVDAAKRQNPDMSPDLQEEVEAMQRFMQISNLLGEISPRVRQSGSAQEWAAQWMAGLMTDGKPSDGLQMPIPDSLDDETAPPFVERYVLATLYHATQGALWRNNHYFLYPKDHCRWFYFDNENFDATQLKSKGPQAPRGVLCNPSAHANDYRIEEIWIANNNLKGQLPSELGLLKGLKILSLDGNKIHGNIPSEFAKLTNLEHLHLEYNRLSGEIEHWVGQSYHKHLQTLVLSNNAFTGTLPNSLRLLTQLTLLALDDNQLSGRPLSMVGNMKNLKYLYLEDNKFSDAVHAKNSFPQLTELIHIDLSNNDFHSPADKSWPHQWLSLPNLQVLDLSNNNLRGPLAFPKAPNDSKLTFLSLQNNKLEGTLPNDIHTYSSLTHLDLSGNALTGLRPDARLANMKQLTSLYLGGTNFIKGPFPIELTTLTDLRELSLKQSNLNGTLPEAIARLSNLLLLDLEGNDIEGEIPSTMGNLTKLGFLLLNRNRLTGTVPLTLDKLNRVELMLLNDNDLSGDVSFLCTTPSDMTGIADAPQQHKLDLLMADCDDGGSVNCTCCHTCCPSGESCNNATKWLGNQAGIWEFGYQRIKWSFDEDSTFSWLPVYIEP